MNNSKVFEEVKLIIAAKNGKCLTDSCANQYTKIKIECGQRHTWEATPKLIKIGRWCPHCYNLNRSSKKLNAQNKLPQIKKFCQEHNIQCLNDNYGGRFKPLLFQCSKGHQWTSNWANVLGGSRCHVCAKIAFFEKANKTPPTPSYKYDLDLVRRVVSEKSGECLSDTCELPPPKGGGF